MVKMVKRVRRVGETSGTLPAIVLAGVVIVVAIFVVEFGLQTIVWINAKRLAGIDPWLADVPQAISAALPQAEPPQAAGRSAKNAVPAKIKAYDYEFTAPWRSPVKAKPGDIFTQFQFDPGQVIVFYDPEAQVDTVGDMKAGKTAQEQQFENVFGQVPDSNYTLYQMVYGASPAQVSPFMNRQEAVRTNVLLLWKLSFGFDMQPGIHSLALGKNRAFEFGDPTSGRPVALRVFDDRDKQFRFIFTTRNGTSGKFAQDDINLAVQSLQSVPILER
jgi:hypothetical protein